MSDYEEILRILSGQTQQAQSFLKQLEEELSMPNIPMPTMGGEVFWNNIAECNGWKLQQNMFTQHARILDDNNVRIAWGSLKAMEKAMDRLVQGLHKYSVDSSVQSQNRLSAMDELKKLKELFDLGALTQEEYESKKAQIMKRF